MSSSRKRINKQISLVMIVTFMLSLLLPNVVLATQGPLVTSELLSESILAEDIVPGQIIVKFKPGKDSIGQKGISAMGAQKAKTSKNGAALYKLKNKDVKAVLKSLKNDPAVAFAEPNYRYKRTAAVIDKSHNKSVRKNVYGDPYYPSQWGLDQIQAPSVWPELETITDRDALVAVIDSGVDASHPDLQDRLIQGKSFLTHRGDGTPYENDLPIDDDGHGTHVAGIIGARTDNDLGIKGVAGNAQVKVMPLKVLNEQGMGTSFDTAAAIDYAVNQRADVINLSLGGAYSQLVADAVENAQSMGVLVVAAAGNENVDIATTFPAALPGVLSVGAVDQSYSKATFSNWGDELDIVAPGVGIWSTTISSSNNAQGDATSGYYASWDGTSMATPYVAGVAALYKLKYPSANGHQISSALTKGTIDLNGSGRDAETGFGLLNAYNALSIPPESTVIPVVEITNPETGSTIFGSVKIQALVSNPAEIQKVRLYYLQNGVTTSIGEASRTEANTPQSLYAFTWNTTGLSDGSYTLVAKAFDQAEVEVGVSTETNVRVLNDTKTGLTLTVLNPAGKPSVATEVELYNIKPFDNHYHRYDKTSLEEGNSAPNYGYDFFWSGVTDQNGILRIPGTIAVDLKEVVVVAKGQFEAIDGLTQPFVYSKKLEGPDSAIISALNSKVVSFKTIDDQSVDISDSMTYFVGLLDPNGVAITHTPVLGDWGDKIYLPEGTYNFHAFSQDEEKVYYLSDFGRQLSQDETITFDTTNTGEVSVSLDPNINRAVVYMGNGVSHQVLGWDMTLGGSKVFVTPGHYWFDADIEVLDDENRPWIYSFEKRGGLEVGTGQVSIPVGGSISLQNVNPIPGNTVKQNNHFGVTSDFIDAHGNYLYSLSKGTLPLTYGLSLKKFTGESTKVFSLIEGSDTWKSTDYGTWVSPVLNITDTNNQLVATITGGFEYSYWWVGNDATGQYRATLTLESNPLARDELVGGPIEFTVVEKNATDEHSQQVVVKDQFTGNPVLHPSVEIYALDREWANHVYGNRGDSLGSISLPKWINDYPAKVAVISFQDSQNRGTVLFRAFQNVEELATIEGANLQTVTVTTKDRDGRLTSDVDMFINLMYDHQGVQVPLTAHVYQPSNIPDIMLEPGVYNMTNNVSDAQSRQYNLIKPDINIIEGQNNQVFFDGTNTVKIDILLHSEGYGEKLDYDLIPSSDHSPWTRHFNVVEGGEIYLTKGIKYNLKARIDISDKEEPTHTWSYFVRKQQAQIAETDFVWKTGGDVTASFNLDKPILTKVDPLSGTTEIRDAYGNELTNMWLQRARDEGPKAYAINPEGELEAKRIITPSEVSKAYSDNWSYERIYPYLRVYQSQDNQEEQRVFNESKHRYFYRFYEQIPQEWTPGSYRAEIALGVGPLGPIYSNPESGQFVISGDLAILTPQNNSNLYSKSFVVTGMVAPNSQVRVEAALADNSRSITPVNVTADVTGKFIAELAVPVDGQWKIKVTNDGNQQEIVVNIDSTTLVMNSATVEAVKTGAGLVKLDTDLNIKAQGSHGANVTAYVTVREAGETVPNIPIEIPLVESQQSPGEYLGSFKVLEGTAEIQNILVVAHKNNQRVEVQALTSGSLLVGANLTGAILKGQNPIANVAVRLVGSNGERVTTYTDSQGKYAFEGLTPGNYNLKVFDSVANQVIEQPVTVTGGKTSFLDNIVLTESHELTLKIRDAENPEAQFKGLWVVLSNEEGFWRTAQVDSTNTVRFSGLLKGTYDWSTFGAEWNLAVPYLDGQGQVYVPTTGESHEILLETLASQRGTIEGKVTDTNQKPVEGVVVSAYSWSPWHVAAAVTDVNGNYQLDMLPAGSNYSISFNHKDYHTLNFENRIVSVKTVTEINADLERGVSVTGVVQGSLGPIAGANIYITNNNGIDVWGQTDGSGRFVLPGLRAGQYEINITTNRLLGYKAITQSIEVLGEGENNHDFTLTKLGSIEGKITNSTGEPLSRVWVYALKEGAWAGSGRTNASGEYVINSLEDGTYSVQTYNGQGFADDTLENLQVLENQVATADITLNTQSELSQIFNGEGNRFRVNSNVVAPGEKLTYRANFKKNSSSQVDSATMTFELSQATEYIPETLTLDGQRVADPVITGNTLSVNIANPNAAGAIGFSVGVKQEVGSVQDIQTKAKIAWKVGAEEFESSFGLASTNLVTTSVNAPGFTKDGKVKVYGKSIPGAIVKVYAGETMLGSTKVDGRWWNLEVQLPTEGTHTLWAQATLGQSTSMPSDGVQVVYDPGTVAVEEVEVTGGWNGNVKINPDLGIVAMGLTELKSFEVKVGITGDTAPEKVEFLWLDKKYTMELSNGYYIGETDPDWTGSGEHPLTLSITHNGKVYEMVIALVTVLIDPSGYVYEGVKSNRLSGVTAIVRQEVNGNWVTWDAAKYGMINPQLTDQEGRYGWDVPAGNWRVVFSKDGYETYTSGVVTVPPPETELNINLKSTSLPTVDSVSYTNGKLEITFSKYMKVNQVNASSITVTKSGTTQPITGTVEAIGAEEEKGVSLARKFRFAPTQQLQAGATYEVEILSGLVAYNDLAMFNDWSDTVTVPSSNTDGGNQSGGSSGGGGLIPDQNNKKELNLDSKGGSLELGNIKLTIPANAFEKNTKVKIEDVSSNYVSKPSIVLSHTGPIVSIDVSDASLAKAATLVLPVDTAKLGKVDPRKAGVYLLSPKGKWQFIGGKVDKVNNTITVDIKSAGTYAVLLHQPKFSDVNSHWAKDDIELLAARFIVKGYEKGDFKPKQQITRAEFASLVVGALGLDTTKPYQGTFKDVAEGAWYSEVVEAAASAGLITGFEAKFNPNGVITREEMATMMVRAMGLTPQNQAELQFSDSAKAGAWAQGYLALALEKGLVKGLDANTLAPKGVSDRAQAVTVMKRFLEQTDRI